MNPLTYIQNMTSEDVQRFVRVALNSLASALIAHGMFSAQASWLEPSIGALAWLATFAWTLYGNRIIAKINEIAKADQVKKVVVVDTATAQAAPSNKVDTK